MTNDKFPWRLKHRCPTGEVAQLQGRWLDDAEEYQAYCESYVYGEDGVEHV